MPTPNVNNVTTNNAGYDPNTHTCPADEQTSATRETVNFPKTESKNEPYPGTGVQRNSMNGANMSTKSVDKTARKPADVCADFYRAIDGLGTDDALFEKVIKYDLSNDNIKEVMDRWDETYGGQYSETFMQSFLNDASFAQRRNLGPVIVETLRDRAIKDGMPEHKANGLANDAIKELKKFGAGKTVWGYNAKILLPFECDRNKVNVSCQGLRGQ